MKPYFTLFVAGRMRCRGQRGSRAGMSVGVAGVALSLVIMLAAVAIVVGFKEEIVNKVRGINSDIILYHSDHPIYLTDNLNKVIHGALGDVSTRLVADQTGILKTPENFQGLTFRGIEAGYDTTFLASTVTAGALAPLLIERTDGEEGAYPIALSESTAASLGLSPGDKVDAFFVFGETVRGRRYRVEALFDTHFSNYDKLTAFVGASSLPGVMEPGMGSSIEINGLGREAIEGATERLYEALLEALATGVIDEMPLMTNVHHTGELYFNWLALLDTNVVVILVLMAVVAGFTLISSLFVIILRRVRMIGILKALGASNREVGNIFVAVTLRIVGLGLLIGDAVGLTLLYIQRQWHVLGLSAENYYLDYVPVVINPWHVLAINVGVAVLSVLVIIGPSRLVSTISPASTMRYE